MSSEISTVSIADLHVNDILITVTTPLTPSY